MRLRESGSSFDDAIADPPDRSRCVGSAAPSLHPSSLRSPSLPSLLRFAATTSPSRSMAKRARLSMRCRATTCSISILDGPATVSVRAADPHFWDRGVEIQPMRYGIRPQRHGAVITFRIPGPVKLSIYAARRSLCRCHHALPAGQPAGSLRHHGEHAERPLLRSGRSP